MVEAESRPKPRNRGLLAETENKERSVSVKDGSVKKWQHSENARLCVSGDVFARKQSDLVLNTHPPSSAVISVEP